MSLFKRDKNYIPLAENIRPNDIEEIFGQEHLFGDYSPIKLMLVSKYLQNIILWGPSGSGKTTLARVLAKQSNYYLETISAVAIGSQEVKQIFRDAINRKEMGQNTLLLVDEIHHFNRTQQDIFLPYLEDGTVTIIGLTTENPSFELNNALLSRCLVLTLKSLTAEALEQLINKAEKFYQRKLPLNKEDRENLCNMVDGDGRYLLNLCESIFALDVSEGELIPFDKISSVQARVAIYDKSRDYHYNLISALHKSIRGSDPDASLYWLFRMLEGGENPYYILRRLVRAASEDIGLSDPNALVQVMHAKEAYDFLGSPEGDLAIVQAVIYLATAPKSNSIYTAAAQVKLDAKKYASLSPPSHILNASTKFMKDNGYGKGYIYDHDTKEGFSGQNYFPDKLPRTQYYYPAERGFEKEIIKRLAYWNNLRKNKCGN